LRKNLIVYALRSIVLYVCYCLSSCCFLLLLLLLLFVTCECGVVLFSVASVCVSVCLSVMLYLLKAFISKDHFLYSCTSSYLESSYVKVVVLRPASHNSRRGVSWSRVGVLNFNCLDVERSFLVHASASLKYLGQAHRSRSSYLGQGHISKKACLCRVSGWSTFD